MSRRKARHVPPRLAQLPCDPSGFRLAGRGETAPEETSGMEGASGLNLEAQQALWEAITQDVNVWRGRCHQVPNLPAPPPPAPAARPMPESTTLPREQTLTPRAPVPALDARRLRRIRSGRLRLEATLDLHGMTQPEAYEALARFVMNATEKGQQLVRVITGKGTRTAVAAPQQRPGGVLREVLPGWCAAPPLRARVRALHPALEKHGGSGAYYVLLRPAPPTDAPPASAF